MILMRKISFKALSEQGRDFNWGEHDCEKCNRGMWGHGFVTRCFSEVVSVLLVKRFRCPSCHVVVTIRPEGYWPRVRSSIITIFTTLHDRFESGRWGLEASRQRSGHWLRRFVKRVRMDWGDASDLKASLEFLYEKQLLFFV